MQSAVGGRQAAANRPSAPFGRTLRRQLAPEKAIANCELPTANCQLPSAHCVMPVLRAFGHSDKGRVRPVNEDAFAVEETLGLCVIADGMGGHNAGEVASQLAVDAVVAAVRDFVGAGGAPNGGLWPFGYDATLSDDGNGLRTAVYVASARVLEASGAADAYAGMGTTIVAARVANGRLSVAHAGDS